MTRPPSPPTTNGNNKQPQDERFSIQVWLLMTPRKRQEASARANVLALAAEHDQPPKANGGSFLRRAPHANSPQHYDALQQIVRGGSGRGGAEGGESWSQRRRVLVHTAAISREAAATKKSN